MVRFLALLTALAIAVPANADIIPISKTIDVTFTGKVEGNVGDTIRIRQPDGQFASFTGEVPDFPYKPGDDFSFSFKATVPTPAYFDPDIGPFRNGPPADGLLRFSVRSSYYTGGSDPGGVGNLGPLAISGPIRPVSNSGQPTTTSGFNIVYDINADSYSLEFPRGTWSLQELDGAGFFYDPLTGSLSNAASTCEGGSSSICSSFGDGGFRFDGTHSNILAQTIPIYGTDPSFPNQPNRRLYGLFDLGFSGSWNLPLFGSDPAPVPAPAALLLFGAGAGALVWRRRRRVRSTSW